MFGKLEIKGNINIKTGMHIGGSSTFSAIGSIDSPVVRDKLSDLPIIPGSSLKGKLRSLLAKKYNQTKITTHSDDAPEILRIFGSAAKNAIKPSRLIFSDLIADNAQEIKDQGVGSLTETKSENTINRATSIANPRHIERVIRGTRFPLSIVYNIEELKEVEQDISLLCEGLKLLTFDYLGGHGSRGYGKIELSSLSIEPVVGELDKDILSKCKQLISEV